VNKTLGTFPDITVRQILDMYGLSDGNFTGSSDNSIQFKFTSMATDVRATCPNNKVAENAAEGFASPVYRYVVTNRPSSPVRLFGFPAMHVCLPHVISGSIFWLSKWGWLPAINERQGFQECSQERIRRLYEEGKRENRIMESVSQQNSSLHGRWSTNARERIPQKTVWLLVE